MVVKERKRLASVARAASILESNLSEVIAEMKDKDKALLCNQYENSDERAAMSYQHQERIMSLMSLVEETSGDEQKIEGADKDKNLAMLVLSKERILVLEQQLEVFREERGAKLALKARVEELRKELQETDGIVGKLKKEMRNVRKIFKKIRDITSVDLGGSKRTAGNGFGLKQTSSKQNVLKKRIFNLTQEALKPTKNLLQELPGWTLADTESFSSDDDEDIPEWNEAIMRDVQLIAQGGIPEVLKSKSIFSPSSEYEDVFERLTDQLTVSSMNKTKNKNGTTPRSPPERLKKCIKNGMQSKIDLAARPTSACASETDSVASSMTTNSRFNVPEQFRRIRRASVSERLHPQERPLSSPEIHNDRNKEFRRIQGSFSDGRIVLSSERNKDS